MVKNRKTRIVTYATFGGIIIVLAYMLLPSVSVTKTHGYVHLVRDPIVSYHAQYGKFAHTLLDVKPFIEQLTRNKCDIVQTSDDSYDVKVILQNKEVVLLDVKYHVGEDGQWERFNVHVSE